MLFLLLLLLFRSIFRSFILSSTFPSICMPYYYNVFNVFSTACQSHESKIPIMCVCESMLVFVCQTFSIFAMAFKRCDRSNRIPYWRLTGFFEVHINVIKQRQSGQAAGEKQQWVLNRPAFFLYFIVVVFFHSFVIFSLYTIFSFFYFLCCRCCL